MNNTWPKITIITPSLNQGQFIEETILSVINQDYPNLEYIIIDGGSTDNSQDIISKYQKQLAYCESQPDKGQSHAINKGLKIATGEIFSWINSDDLLAPNALYVIAKSFLYKKWDALCGFTTIFDQEKKREDFTYRMFVGKTAEETFLSPVMNQPGTFYRKEVVMSLGGLNESLDYIMDLELWRRFLLSYDIKGVSLSDEILAFFRLHRESKTIKEKMSFIYETQHLNLFFAVQMKLPPVYIEILKSELKGCKSTYIWSPFQAKCINLSVIRKKLITNFLFGYFYRKDIKTCRKLTMQCLAYDLTLFNWRLFKLFVKVFVLGTSIDTFIFTMRASLKKT